MPTSSRFYNETGIALVAGKSKPPPVDAQGQPIQPDPLTTTPLFYALSNFLRNAAELTAGGGRLQVQLRRGRCGRPYGGARQNAPGARPPATWRASRPTVTAVKANEAILTGKRIELKPEWYELK